MHAVFQPRARGRAGRQAGTRESHARPSRPAQELRAHAPTRMTTERPATVDEELPEHRVHGHLR
jgi:hypothetical protein